MLEYKYDIISVLQLQHVSIPTKSRRGSEGVFADHIGKCRIRRYTI